MKSCSSSWVSQNGKALWKFLYILSDIIALSLRVISKLVIYSANDIAGLLAKQNVDMDDHFVHI